jgi:hypothetical protein
MNDLKAPLAKLANIHTTIAKSHPKLERSLVWCHSCGAMKTVDTAHCLATGWPQHCGQTMSLDFPDKYAERRAGEA